MLLSPKSNSPRSPSFSHRTTVLLAAMTFFFGGSRILAAEFEVAFRDRSGIYLLSTSGD